jgi:hypothetical protein
MAILAERERAARPRPENDIRFGEYSTYAEWSDAAKQRFERIFAVAGDPHVSTSCSPIHLGELKGVENIQHSLRRQLYPGMLDMMSVRSTR